MTAPRPAPPSASPHASPRADGPVTMTLGLELPGEPSTVALVRHVIEVALRDLGVDEDVLADVVLALSEACANVIWHSGDQEGYAVRVEVDDGRCVVQVTDRGRGPGRAMSEHDVPHPLAVRGRGLSMMRAVMDSVVVEAPPSGGTSVQLVRTLRGRDLRVRGQDLRAGRAG